MRTNLNNFLLLVAAMAATIGCESTQAGCSEHDGVALQVLGSGGPIADDGRASSAYLVWVDGRSKVLIDAGGGAFLRFGEAGASFTDLDFVGLSHFHTDHSADFPALLKSGNFSRRQRPLYVAGPDERGRFPGLEDWLERMLDEETGAYGYLAGFLDGTAGLAMLVSREVGGEQARVVYTSEGLSIEAMHVPHGIVPAVAFKVRAGERTLVFASDQNGSKASFAEFAGGASLLVMHLVVPEGASGVARRLHAPPSVIGMTAEKAKAQKLVLSHFMARSLDDLEANVELVDKNYNGEIILAEDLACIRL